MLSSSEEVYFVPSAEDKEVVVVLPVKDNRVLLQLRDAKGGIDAPGCWGFFGGGIAPDETPVNSAKREIAEEIGFSPQNLYPLGKEKILDLEHRVAHAFCCELTVPVEELVLAEGMDLQLVPLEDVLAKRIYSHKMKEFYPTVPTYYIAKTMSKALQVMADRNQSGRQISL